jgi:hypothetical protein
VHGAPVGQTAWRRAINQHETFDHDSIDSLFYDWDRIGDPAGPPRSPLKFYVPRTTDDVVRCVRGVRPARSAADRPQQGALQQRPRDTHPAGPSC